MKKHREKKLRQIHQTTSFYSKLHHTSTTPQPTRCDSPLNSWHRPVGWIGTSTRSALENLCKPMKTMVPFWSENQAKSGQLKRSSSLAVESKLDWKNRNVDLVTLLCFSQGSNRKLFQGLGWGHVCIRDGKLPKRVVSANSLKMRILRCSCIWSLNKCFGYCISIYDIETYPYNFTIYNHI